jgi:glycine amidinotransferase/scyllo-inosamine-4-phosphate amidinotransferase 1
MISSVNEWSPLKKIVVGSATDANWPVNDPVFSKESEKTTWKETPVPRGPVPQRIIDEANEDLDTLATTLIGLGVEVVRPDPLNFQAHDGMYNYCPRDRFLVYGSTVVDPAMMYPCRDMELQCYHNIVDSADQYLFMPRNEGMTLDAANVLRLNDKMLFLESASGNRAAYNWLCDQFPDVTIELCNFYAGVHIDSTIVALREGLVMLNSSRVGFDSVPKVFDGWQKIWVNEVVAQDFYQYPYASKWIAMNMLTVDPNTVIVDRHQTELIKTLKSYRFEVIPLELRHSRTLGGGFHCVTLDLNRQTN